MVAYQQFVELSQSRDSEARSQAAHFAAMAFVGHKGPVDEQAALYAALIGFLDDASVKVRAALAYGLLHAKGAPRPIMMSFLHDAPVIARAVAQYSPVLVEADLLAVIKTADIGMLDVICVRPRLSTRVAYALLERDITSIVLKVLARQDVALSPGMLDELTATKGDDAKIRGVLLTRTELSGAARYQLIEQVRDVLSGARIVKGAVAPLRLERLLRDVTDTALTSIGERETSDARKDFAKKMVGEDRVNARLMLHAIVNGHVLFFAECIGILAQMPQEKVFSLLDRGSRAALNALLSKCGLNATIRNLLARLIFYARTTNLSDDLAARHFIVTALIDELIAEHEGLIPPALEDAFAYLNEQNVALARRAARGVMPAFAREAGDERKLPAAHAPLVALPAA